MLVELFSKEATDPTRLSEWPDIELESISAAEVVLKDDLVTELLSESEVVSGSLSDSEMVIKLLSEVVCSTSWLDIAVAVFLRIVR